MVHPVVRFAVRTVLAATGRRRALAQARRHADRYLALARGLDAVAGARPVEVPPMAGVDEEMRRWSLFMLLEHNAIVNRGISALVGQLARGEPLHGAAILDVKRDVLPSPAAGEEQVAAFRDSVDDHLATVAGLGRLRGTATAPHPLFGDFDAHKWNAMFAFHLRVHRRQAEIVARTAGGGAHSGGT